MPIKTFTDACDTMPLFPYGITRTQLEFIESLPWGQRERWIKEFNANAVAVEEYLDCEPVTRARRIRLALAVGSP